MKLPKDQHEITIDQQLLDWNSIDYMLLSDDLC